MKAFSTVAARNGRFLVEDERAIALADLIRQDKPFVPTLGVYAAYAYAQVGAYAGVESVFSYMARDEIPVPFDVVMLAARLPNRPQNLHQVCVAPFAPMLSQGWSLLDPDDPLHCPVHARLRQHLVPSLWTTLDAQGVEIARNAIRSMEVT
jgi:hypothetical protein